MMGRTLKGQYRVEGVLGEGAMGVVFRGVNAAMDKPVAIKMMRREAFSTPDAVERFNREARVWSQLNHPAIAHVFDFGVEDGMPFLVMELVEGADVSDVLSKEGKLDSLRAVRLMRQLAGALEEAHRHGVVHRDIKPQNIKLLRYQPGGKIVLKVLDFGMAKQVNRQDQRLTQPGMLVGTPKYVAPEQITENPVIDGRTDLYAAGVLFYELLTGNAPFLGTPHEVLFAHLGSSPAPLPATIPPILSDVVMRLLRKRPEERFPDAAALEQALEECEDHLRAASLGNFSSGLYPPISMSGSNFTPVAPSAGSGSILPATGSLRTAAAALATSGTSSGPNSAISYPEASARSRNSGPSLPKLVVPAAALSSPATTPTRMGLAGRIGIGALFVLILGGAAATYYATRHSLAFQRSLAEFITSYKVPQDEEVQRTLQVLEGAHENRQWRTVLDGTQDIERRYGPTLLPEQAAALESLKQRAKLEQPMQDLYERLVAAAARSNSEEVVRLHDQIVINSAYRRLAQPYYDLAIENFIRSHLEKAEMLRNESRCPEYQAEVQRVLDAAPGNPQAILAQRRPCPPPPPEPPPEPTTPVAPTP